MSKRMAKGFIIAAPGSGSGKTTLTLALLRGLHRNGVAVGSAKVGPDYIDPAFHTAASGRACYNLDTWAMRPQTIGGLLSECIRDTELLVVEGVMGLFDGAPDGRGSTADLARVTGLPVVLVVDASGMAASAAAVLFGFAHYRDDVTVAGVIFNRVGGARHGQLLRDACASTGVPVLGCIPRNDKLVLPDRHLGLVQAREHDDLEGFLNEAADTVLAEVDIELLMQTAAPVTVPQTGAVLPLGVIGQRIAVAHDDAFAFCYPFVLESWRRQGAEVKLFSPLADDGPDTDADAVYLPGGYPELHAGTLANNRAFVTRLRDAAERGCAVYGECGGYMVLGQALTDANGERHAMSGLLPVETSFAKRRLSLGYREVRLERDTPLGKRGETYRGHEFHFASIIAGDGERAPFFVSDASGNALGAVGSSAANVVGSFVHLVDRI